MEPAEPGVERKAPYRFFAGLRTKGISAVLRQRAGYAQERRERVVDAAQTPLMGRPYDLRHATVSTWLNARVPAAQVAEWAGHGTDVLLRVYVKCIAGQQGEAERRIEDAMGPPEADEPDSTGQRSSPEHPGAEHSGP
jgi:hypothetical protein